MSEPYNAIESLNLMIEVQNKLSETKAVLNLMQSQFDTEAAPLRAQIAEGESILHTAKEELRFEALKAFEADPSNKKPFPAVQIKEITSYEVDEKAGLAWARVNAPIYVLEVLDTKAIKKVAPVLSEVPDFIKVTKTPQAQIASDLNAALQAVAEGA